MLFQKICLNVQNFFCMHNHPWFSRQRKILDLIPDSEFFSFCWYLIIKSSTNFLKLIYRFFIVCKSTKETPQKFATFKLNAILFRPAEGGRVLLYSETTQIRENSLNKNIVLFTDSRASFIKILTNK